MKLKILFAAGLILMLSSCIKKIQEVDDASTNIFDPEYTGEQWFIYEEVSMYTNSNNDTKIRIDIKVPEENVPTLNPVGFSIWSKLNNSAERIDSLTIDNAGDYTTSLIYDPDGSTDYCIDLGIYNYNPDTVFNIFSECKSL